MMFVIGLTGGIASGKSTISAMLRAKGAHILDADIIAREIVEPDLPAWKEIVDYFGPGVLREDRHLDRAALGKAVFDNPEALTKLNGFTHPRVIARVDELTEYYRKTDPSGVVVVDAPLLIEAGMTNMVDEIWVVATDQDTQVKRLMERDKLSREASMKRINSQMPLKDKMKFAHQVIDTTCALEETKKQVDQLLAEAVK
ncbi:MAG: dephospho-CoA kinase [Bacillota bacterium]